MCVYGSVLQLMKQIKDYHKNLHEIYATQLLIAYMSIYLVHIWPERLNSQFL